MTKKEIASMIDDTVLDATATFADIEQLCGRARKYGFASVCVNPVYVKFAAAQLAGSDVSVCTVIGFPLGAGTSRDKAAQAVNAVMNGANELDMVIAIGLARDNAFYDVEKDIAVVVKAAHDAERGMRAVPDAQGKKLKPVIVKVILETCYLTDDQITECSFCAKHAGADFVKTSTGFGTPKDKEGKPLPSGATVHAVSLMRKAVGSGMGIKASGGIRSAEDAMAMIKAGATRIGTSHGQAIVDSWEEK